tara:strand:+ start:4659 stop:5558 length:900 start_codon:yes stop_codon:yes gene_type:complete
MSSKVEITLWSRPLTKAKVGNVKKFVDKNKTMLNKLSTNRNWEVWIRKKKNMSKGIGGAPPTKKRIETGSLIKGKVIVPDQAKGAIKQKDKNLTAYGKEANAAEPNTVLKSAIKKDWTIVTDNCYGVAYMKALNKPYESPFFSMFIFAPDYLTLLENFDEYMKLTPKAQSPSGKTRFYDGRDRKYPVIILDGPKGPVEIHMAHEKQSSEEAIRKWKSRKSRMNMDKSDMFVKMDSRDKFTVSLGKRFLALKQFPHKKLFVAEKYRKDFIDKKNVVIMSNYKTQPPIGTTTEKLYPVPSK